MRILAFCAVAMALNTAAACSSISDRPSGDGGAGGTGTSTSSGGGAGGGGAGGGTSSSTSTGTGGGMTCEEPADPQVFEMGTGEKCFERLMAGQTVTVMQGPQGGYHLWIAFGCSDCGAQAILQYGIKDPATHDWYKNTSPSQVVVPISKSGWYQQAGFTDFLPGLIYVPDSVLPKGTHVIMAAAVLDAQLAVKHEAEVEVVLGDEMLWYPPCDTGPNCGAPGGLPCCSDADGGTFGDAGAPPDSGSMLDGSAELDGGAELDSGL